MQIRESAQGYWSSPAGFVWAATGAVVGIGNLARLPYLMGQHGGLLFLLTYVLALFAIALPLLVTEWLLGRWTRSDAVGVFQRLQGESSASRFWQLLGWLSLLSGVLILSYFSVIAGWSAAFGFRAAGGTLAGSDAASVRETFLALAQDPERGLSWHTIFMVMACIIVAHGVREGMERMARIWVPIALLLAFTVCAYALANGNAGAALSYLFKPELSKLGWLGVAEALHMAFFTAGLGMGVMLTLGSYLPANAPIMRTALMVLLLDTVFSLLAGVALFALIFSAGLDPAPGLKLIFQILPQALPQGAWGIWVGVMFYALLFIIAMSSAVALLEPATRYAMERLRVPRVFAATSAAMAIWYLGIGSLLSFSLLNEATLLGRNFFEWVQWLTASVFAPMTGLLLCIFVARVMPQALQRALWGERHERAYRLWAWMMRFPVRIGLIVVILQATGLLAWLVSLWQPGRG